ncbi:FAD-binding protein [Gloeobacter kilaueensis]|uniref:UDP-N-acetylenolpyruvoylglucosamine reductase n=1 Tax=Gloeobacter kilaueensis (strain ATCC BAA-2537 / CCAP 1431/1 / ULC 316 / JS1) TaxID=1183438 RepID=U5QFS0_GLOK1|nr:FAD-binding protein [Gloeobacter kilaueensis]AGY56530.1 UDP-N-acetylenolpyruvoylglucosamine reductase [Gloeobacter kilaueensis JS1]
MVNVISLDSNQLSTFRTHHHFEHYGEFHDLDEFAKYSHWAALNNAKVYILGNGSNTLFTADTIRALVLKNCIPKLLKSLPDNRLEISSSVQINDVLNYCYQRSLTSFYYLASVPASIGGALAMNAGRGRSHNCTIYDFVESVTFFDGETVKTLKNDEIARGYRKTIFTGMHEKLILSAILQFERTEFGISPISERRQFAKEHQDNTQPNCGTVFKSACYPIMDRLRGIRVGEAQFSQKTSNWILNKSASSRNIMRLIAIAKLLHLVTFRKIELEVISVN